ncbi:glycosyl transferase, family II [Desulfosarcina variabilis str. Montpellier]|uniref:glycosyltransferase family 2 protein n=1 Tax=Desulfosarcina variabilis TaxID=2300 RepID=UPI003AFAF414
MKKISMVVGTFNQARYLPICLDSIWFQDWSDLEIIVVNDGSNDTTRDVLDAYVKAVALDRVSYASNCNEETDTVERYEHLRYPPEGRELQIIHHPENVGLGGALNTGFRAATGEYCSFIASDDILLPSAISELASLLEQGYDFAYADMHIVDDSGRILRRFSLPDYSFENAFCQWYLCGVCKLYKRELHDRVGYYDEQIKPQDHDMFLRFAMNGAKFVHIPKVLANVRIHDGEREVANHSPANWNRLYNESATLVKKARQWSKFCG